MFEGFIVKYTFDILHWFNTYMNIKKYNLLILFSVFSALNLSAQHFGWKAGYLGFLDNREYDNIYNYDQTMFGSRISLEGRALLDDRNSIGAGIDYLYEFGSKGELDCTGYNFIL